MKKIIIFLIIFSFLSLATPGTTLAATEVGGSIVNPVWTVDNSPYVISNTLEIAKGAKLVINPGVVVKFNKGAKILVKGQLEILGTETNKVVLTSNQASPARGDWAGIEFTSDSVKATLDKSENYVSGSIIKYAIIKYGNTIKIDNTSPFLYKNLILNNNVGISVVGENSQTTTIDNTSSSTFGKTIINNNSITDNTIGVLVDRYNKNQYTSTPAGEERLGSFIETSIIKNNEIVNNTQGIYIKRGDNNIVLKNNINNNDMGVKIDSISEENVFNGNSINNNKVGLAAISKNNKIQQNNFINNSSYGIYLENSNNFISDNNIYNNKEYNVYNSTGSISLGSNYWNETKTSEIQKTIKLATTTDSAIVEPAKTSAINVTALPSATLNNLITKTTESKLTLTGLKPAGTRVTINGQEAVDLSNETTWQYNASLNIGDNTFMIAYRDADNNGGPAATVNITREKVVVINDPVLNSFPSNTTSGKYKLSGSKDAGTAIIINDKEVVAANDNTTWEYEVALAPGSNKFNLKATDNNNHQSNEISATIIYNEKNNIKVDANLSKKLSGYILLQVENKGMAWYVNPNNNKRYYLGRQADALKIMSKLGLGVKSEIIKKGNFGSNLIGKILLDVANSGKAYYIYPKDKKAYSLGKPEDAYSIMRTLGLGISNENINKIDIGE